MTKVVDVYPDKSGIVRNVEVAVAPKFDGSKKYKPQAVFKVKRHVSKLIVLVPIDEESEVADQHLVANDSSQGDIANDAETESQPSLSV